MECICSSFLPHTKTDIYHKVQYIIHQERKCFIPSLAPRCPLPFQSYTLYNSNEKQVLTR